MRRNKRIGTAPVFPRSSQPEFETRLNEMLGQSGPVVWEIVMESEACRFEFLSDSVQALLGYEISQWYAHPEFIFEIMHPDDRVTVRPELLRRVRAGEAGDARFRLIARDGRVVWVETHWRVSSDSSVAPGSDGVNPELDGNGPALRVRGATTEITAAMQAEVEAGRTHALLDAIAQGTSDLVFVKDTQGRYIFANRAKAAALGRQAELIGKTAGDLYAPEDARKMMESDARVLEWGETVNYLTEAKRRGSRVVYLMSKTPIRDESGKVVGLVGIAHDITERETARRRIDQLNQELQSQLDELRRGEGRERFLSEANRLLAHSLDYAPTLDMVARLAVPTLADCCFVHLVDDADASLRLLAVAHRDRLQEESLWELHRRFPRDFTETIGIPRVRLTGIGELQAAIDLETGSAYARDADHQRLVRALGFRSTMVVPLAARDRILGTVSFAYGRATGEAPDRRFASGDLEVAGRLVERAAIAIDNARLFREADAARREAEAANRTKDEFLATLSHELRTPLSAIAGWIYLLKQGRLDAASVAKAFDSIERSAQSQTQLVEDLLDVSRIVSGKLRLDLQPLSLGATILAAADTVRPAARAKHIDFQTEIGAAPTPVLGDPQRLQQVVWNLLSNAIKFTMDGGMVRVAVVEDGDIAEIVVADSGIGIAPEFLPLIFQRFRQADSSTTRRYSGLGLGLALVRHLVEMHGGTVQVQSEGVGHGTTFSVRLPLAADLLAGGDFGQPAPATKRAAATGDATTALEGLRILLVDDEPDALGVAEEVLTRAGAQVRTAESAATAIAILGEWNPHVLVSDIGMPNEDGYLLLERVRALPPEQGGIVPAIALTAYARDADRMRTAAAGYRAHLTKPVHAETLCEVVRAIAHPVLSPES